MAENHLKLIDTVVDRQADKQLASHLPVAVQRLREQSRTFLGEKLASCFEQVDDTFFDLADRAENNAEQAGYFDAMRMIRLGRKGIEQRFADGIGQAFNRLADESSQSVAVEPELDAADSLEVLDNDALEEAIAIEAMASKVANRSKDVLRNLITRIDSLVPVQVNRENNPLGPECICRVISSSLSELDIGVRAKLVFFKLIDRYLMGALNDWLNEVNDQMRKSGVLPELEMEQRAAARQKKQNRLAAMSQQSASARPAREKQYKPGASNYQVSESSQVIDQLQGILQPVGETASDDGDFAAPAAQPTIALNDLIALVGDLQQSNAREMSGEQSLLGVINQGLQNRGNAVLRGRDQSVVQVLEQMFGHIRHRSGLSKSGFSQQLGKLEMPVLRIALQDGSFFDQHHHPARQLLNQITDIAIGYDDNVDISSDSVGKAVSEVVEKINQSANLDHATLKKLLLDFGARIEKERRRALMMEQRTVDEVAAAEKVNHAHREVKALLNNRMKGRRLPRILVAFVQEAWCRVLFMAYLKYGKNSKPWNTAVKVTDQLLCLALKEKVRPSSVKPVMTTARERLQDVGYDPYRLGRLVGGLEQYFSLKGALRTAAPANEPAGDKGKKHSSESSQGSGTAEQPEAAIATSDQAVPPASKSKHADKPTFELVTVGKLDADLPGDSTAVEGDAAAENGSSDLNEACLKTVDRLVRGSWVNFVDEHSDTRRCKVAGIISPPGKYIFVNRLGVKVVELSRCEVAERVRDKQLVVLDTGQVFDQALQTVIRDIREHRKIA